MSHRAYVKDHQMISIESIGETPKNPADDDIWSVITTLEEGVEIRSILWTSQIKETIAGLENKGWRKQGDDKKEP